MATTGVSVGVWALKFDGWLQVNKGAMAWLPNISNLPQQLSSWLWHRVCSSWKSWTRSVSSMHACTCTSTSGIYLQLLRAFKYSCPKCCTIIWRSTPTMYVAFVSLTSLFLLFYLFCRWLMYVNVQVVSCSYKWRPRLTTIHTRYRYHMWANQQSNSVTHGVVAISVKSPLAIRLTGSLQARYLLNTYGLVSCRSNYWQEGREFDTDSETIAMIKRVSRNSCLTCDHGGRQLYRISGLVTKG
jgi:hypothetical protein